MREIDFFGKLLGLRKPWKVCRVSLSSEEKRVDVAQEHQRRAQFSCKRECRWHWKLSKSHEKARPKGEAKRCFACPRQPAQPARRECKGRQPRPPPLGHCPSPDPSALHGQYSSSRQRSTGAARSRSIRDCAAARPSSLMIHPKEMLSNGTPCLRAPNTTQGTRHDNRSDS
jgi:hypothetical protein